MRAAPCHTRPGPDSLRRCDRTRPSWTGSQTEPGAAQSRLHAGGCRWLEACPIMQSSSAFPHMPALSGSSHAIAAGAIRLLDPGADTRPQPLHLRMGHAGGLLAIHIVASRTAERDVCAHLPLAE